MYMPLSISLTESLVAALNNMKKTQMHVNKILKTNNLARTCKVILVIQDLTIFKAFLS